MSDTIVFLPSEQEVEINGYESVLEAALAAKVELDHECGGMATCGTCRVFVRKGLEKLEPRNEVEQEIADDRGFTPEERLCCQMTPHGGLVLEIP